jgi:hypothetical protein
MAGQAFSEYFIDQCRPQPNFSALYSLDERTTIKRKAVPENLCIKPAVISFYNKFMNGVDL